MISFSHRVFMEVAANLSFSKAAQTLFITQPAISKHIKALEQARLIRREVRGRTHFCRLEPAALASAHEWLSFYQRFWTGRLDRLEQLLCVGDARKSKGEKQ